MHFTDTGLAAYLGEAVVCMASDTFPIDRRTWAFPVWGI